MPKGITIQGESVRLIYLNRSQSWNFGGKRSKKEALGLAIDLWEAINEHQHAEAQETAAKFRKALG